MATGRKTVVVGQVIDPVAWGNPLWDQSVQTFASAADRTAQFSAPKQGALTWLDDVKRLEVWDGATWGQVNYGKATAAFTPDPALWVADGASPSSLTRLGGRWLLTGFVRNKATGAFSVGSSTLGSVDVAARVASAPPTIRSAGLFALPAGASQVVGVQINPATGVVSLIIPAAIASISAGQAGLGWQLTWDAT